jgi:DNA-binding NtrC family response regulator
VRQLENAVEMAIALSGDRTLLEVTDFPVVESALEADAKLMEIDIPDKGLEFNTVVSDLERKLILRSLQITNGNKKKAASLLHLKRTTFVEKLKRMGMEVEDAIPESGINEFIS